ncbi:peptidoglycan DD-metalloendopeptidase family protein [Streptomyces smyrnaeus]|uniref:peptidoglycan DD-metalloendopeptidase family protein n=1 Tax=Streptomyces smyrnaeus TaxID=1387713 RepID=UPI0033BB1B1B
MARTGTGTTRKGAAARRRAPRPIRFALTTAALLALPVVLSPFPVSATPPPDTPASTPASGPTSGPTSAPSSASAAPAPEVSAPQSAGASAAPSQPSGSTAAPSQPPGSSAAAPSQSSGPPTAAPSQEPPPPPSSSEAGQDAGAGAGVQWVRPVVHPGVRVSQPYGVRGNWAAGHHTGVDLAVPEGTPVRSVGPGTVVFAGWAGAYGKAVTVRMPDGKYILFAHLSEIHVTTGAVVRPGTWVGLSGNTGRSTGPHLHFEVRAGRGYGSDIDPVRYLAAHGVRLV